MIDVLEKDFLVCDKYNGARVIKAENSNEAAKLYLNGESVLSTFDCELSAVMVCEFSYEVEALVLSKEVGVGQAEALAKVPGVKHFSRMAT